MLKKEYVINNVKGSCDINDKNYPKHFNDNETRKKWINIKLEYLHNYDKPINIYAMYF